MKTTFECLLLFLLLMVDVVAYDFDICEVEGLAGAAPGAVLVTAGAQSGFVVFVRRLDNTLAAQSGTDRLDVFSELRAQARQAFMQWFSKVEPRNSEKTSFRVASMESRVQRCNGTMLVGFRADPAQFSWGNQEAANRFQLLPQTRHYLRSLGVEKSN